MGEYEQKRDVLEREDALLEKITGTQTAVQDAVVKREWTDFESLLLSMSEYKEQFEALEAERMSLFSDNQPDSDDKIANFYHLIANFPEKERREFADIYRNIKARSLKVKMANDALLLYLSEAKITLDAFMKAVFPENSGVYSRQGARVSSDMRSMVLDQVL
jgi:hypothetical protein